MDMKTNAELTHYAIRNGLVEYNATKLASL
jgi:hypothetical protein